MEIQLKNGGVAIIDDEDWHLVFGKSWSSSVNKNVTYVRSGRTYLHRLIINAKSGQIVDHINGNGLDNRKVNLRFTTHQGNKANSHHGKYTSKYIGVSRLCNSQKAANKFRVQVKHDGKNVHIGYFKTEVEAAQAYDLFARQKHGINAILNFQ